MRFLQRRSICFVLVMVAVIFAGTARGAAPELPKGLVMNATFKPGYGAPIGKFRTVQGKVVIMHADKKEGYWARKNLPLYKGDVIVTQKKSRTNFIMNDKSIISLSSNTRLVLTKSIYDEKKKSRSSFLGLTIGKARFIVSKLLSFKRKEFKVKTVTAVCGVRGSDFIIVATEEFTEVTALENTKLAVVSLAKPDEPPVIVQDFQRTGVEMGQLPYEAEIVPPEEIQELKQDVSTPSEDAVTGEQQDVKQEESAEEEDAATDEADEEGAGEEGAAAEETGDEGSAEGDAETEDTQETEAAEEEATSEEAQADESAAGDTESEEAQSDESSEGETTSGETQSEEAPADDDASGGTQADESGTGTETTGDQDAEAGAGAGVATTDSGEATPDVSTDQEEAATDMAPEGDGVTDGTDIGQDDDAVGGETEGGVDPGAVYVSEESLVEPELPTEIELPVVDIENIVVDVGQEQEVAEHLAEQIKQEDLEIPPIPGTPE